MGGQYVFEEIKQRYEKSNKYMLCLTYEDIGIALNLIEKQSKEIKELKEKNKDARERIEYYLVGNFTLNDFDKRNKELRKIEKILEE